MRTQKFLALGTGVTYTDVIRSRCREEPEFGSRCIPGVWRFSGNLKTNESASEIK